MSQVDYYGIQEAIQAQLQNSLTTQGVTIEIEPTEIPDMKFPFIGIYLEESPRDLKFIGGNKPHLVKPMFRIACLEFHAEIMRDAIKKRDVFLKEVEEVLLLDRKFNNKIATSLVTKVEFDTGKNNPGYFAEGDIILETEVRG